MIPILEATTELLVLALAMCVVCYLACVVGIAALSIYDKLKTKKD